MAEQRFKVVELGGGNSPHYSRKLGNGINVDKRPSEYVDIVADFEEPLPLSSDEFDEVYSAYVFEHISWRKVSQFISEIHRILKMGGKAIIVTANLLEQARVLVNKSIWDLNDLCMIFGGLDYPENSHKSSMSPELAVRLFKDAGFTSVTILPLKGCMTDMVIHANKGVVDPRVEWILSQIGENEKIVDVGCADGWVLRGHRNSIIYVDIDPQLLPNFVQADAATLGTRFAEKQFDIAVLAELLEHVTDPVTVLRSAWKIAKRLVITVPNEYEWSENNGPFKSKSHIRFYTAEMLTQHLVEAGLQNFRIDKMTVNGVSGATGELGKMCWFVTTAS